jgi:CO/xanthine dehydrogenase FAD-binding subunit
MAVDASLTADLCAVLERHPGFVAKSGADTRRVAEVMIGAVPQNLDAEDIAASARSATEFYAACAAAADPQVRSRNSVNR